MLLYDSMAVEGPQEASLLGLVSRGITLRISEE